MLYSSAESDESRIAVANAWATRRGSQPRLQSDREKIALDITILKKQYDKLRERQKQAHIILSSAVSKQNQQQKTAGSSSMNKLLVGKNAIISKGRKGPPKGAIPPVRNQKLAKSTKALPKPDETLHWKNTDDAKKRRNSLSWKELNAERRTEDVKTMSKSSSASSLGSSSKLDMASPKRRSDSSSYSEDSDCESSPSTSLCDDDVTSSLEASPMKKKRHKDLPSLDLAKKSLNMKTIEETSPTTETKDCPVISISCVEGDTKPLSPNANFYLDLDTGSGDITSISQLSPMPDLSSYFTAISPITTPSDFFEFPNFSSFLLDSEDKFQVTEDGVSNEFFERVYEENAQSAATPEGGGAIMSKSFSPSILKEAAPETKYIKQKSFSMDEQSCEKEEVVAINRSHSDGTIIGGVYDKIIAENTKILSKMIPYSFLSSPDNLETHFAKLNIESVIIEEPKSPNNLSDVEEEIAAIDGVEEADEALLLSDIQDLASDERFLERRASDSHTRDESVTEEKSEKSICDEGEESDLATRACITLKNKSDAEREPREAEQTAKVEPPRRAEEVKCESPKFNEIQAMVEKLKEEMESQLKASEAEGEVKIAQSVDEKKSEPNASEKAAVPRIVVQANSVEKPDEPTSPQPAAEPVKSETREEAPREVEASSSKKASKADGDLETVASYSVEKIDKSDSDVALEKLNTQLDKCQKPESEETHESDSPNRPKMNEANQRANEGAVKRVPVEVRRDTEAKTSRDASTQFNESKSVATETKAELMDEVIKELKEKVTMEPVKQVKVEPKAEPVIEAKAEPPREQPKETKVEPPKEVRSEPVREQPREVRAESPREAVKVESAREVRPDPPREIKKDSNEILEHLNQQLQRSYGESPKSSKVKSDESSISYVTSSSSSLYSKEKPTTYETSAIMELAVLIKERELEKLSEQKLLMKAGKEVDFDLSVSPVRTQKSKSNVSSPDATSGKFNNFFYDHEPRNEIRRRDIATLETEQRLRRQFKSSPTTSLSSSPSNISNTLSSIQNTIKILDSACSNTDPVTPNKHYNLAMENVEKLCDSNLDWMNYKKPVSAVSKYEPSPTFRIDDVSYDTHHTPKRRPLIDDDKGRDYDLSPRRKRYDFDTDEPLFRSSRDVSPRVSPSRFSARTPEVDPNYVAKLRYLSTEDYIAGRKSPLGGSREHLDTKFKIDRSPTSPVLSSTHFSRSPRSPRSPSHSSSLLRFPSNDNRSSKSAENSPSRYSGERVETSYKYNSAAGTIDSKADSMSNLTFKSTRKYDYDWETPSNKKKFDFY